MRPWFEEKPEVYSGLQDLLCGHYPSLHPIIEHGRVYVRGALPIVVDGIEVDRFQIEIELPSNYPLDVPIVRETAGRLEKIDSRHFNGDGTACLFLKDESYKFYTQQSTIVDFIDICVKNFFIWQIEYDLTDGKPTRKARGHGVLGTIEFYKEELQTDSLDVIIKFLEYITSKKMKGHWTCYCGSGKELRRCHLDRARDLQGKIIRKYALNSLSTLNLYKQAKNLH